MLADVEGLRGRLSRSLGDFTGAERHYRESLRLAASRGDAYQQAAALSNLATVQMRRSRYDQALAFLRQALAFADRAGAVPLKSAVLANIAMCETRFGEFERAVAAHQQNIALQQNAGIPLPVVLSSADIGAIRLFENRPAEALENFQRAAALALRIGAHEQAADMKGEVAHALLELGRIDEAERENAHAIAIRSKHAPAKPSAELELNAAEIACARGRCSEAVRVLKSMTERADIPEPLRWRAHAALGRAHAALGENAHARRSFEAALAHIERRRAGLAKTDYKLGFLRHLMRFYRDYVDYLVRDGDDAHALEIVESSRAQLFARRAESERAAFDAVSTTALRRRAAAHNVVLLSYWLAPERSHLWVISARGLKRYELPADAHIARLVQKYRDTIENRLRDPLIADPASGTELYRLLIQPARDLIGPDAEVVIAADGALHNLNFETLIVPAPKAHYWIEDVTVSVTPALRLLDSGGAVPRPSVLAFGDAEQVEEQYPALPRASEELSAIKASFDGTPVTLRTRHEATPAAWHRSRPEQFSVIHFAAHAVASRESPLDSAIMLSRENGAWKLYTRDIAESTLNADLVTVSACRSAGARAFSGEGLVGFAWAFLHAGARGVVAGLWDVSDRRTANLMAGLYKSLGSGERPAPALRAAKLVFIRAGGNLRKPYNWAAFQLYTRAFSHLTNNRASVKRSSS
jgi:CHAT domain-containing protein